MLRNSKATSGHGTRLLETLFLKWVIEMCAHNSLLSIAFYRLLRRDLEMQSLLLPLLLLSTGYGQEQVQLIAGS